MLDVPGGLLVLSVVGDRLVAACGVTHGPGIARAVRAAGPAIAAGARLDLGAAHAAATDLAALTAVLRAAGEEAPPLALLVGPEGGLTDDEVRTLVAQGWQTVTLGRRILRAETAALAGVAVLMARSGELDA